MKPQRHHSGNSKGGPLLFHALPFYALLFLVAHVLPVQAAMFSRIPDVPERIGGSKKVVVANVQKIEPRWETNSYGDKLIVSRIELRVEETIKGSHEPVMQLDLEGGTLDGLTLRVSDLPEVKVGERGVFFLDGEDKKVKKSHLRGFGILKLDSTGTVEKSSLNLKDIRRMAGEKE